MADDGAFSVCAVVGGQDVAIAITLYVGTGFTASQYQVLGFYYGMSEWMLMQIAVVCAARRRFMKTAAPMSADYVNHAGNGCGFDSYAIPLDPSVVWNLQGFSACASRAVCLNAPLIPCFVPTLCADCPVNPGYATLNANLTLSALPVIPSVRASWPFTQ